MKYLITLAAAALTAVMLLAQTTTQPQPIDFRYSLSWTDPNAAGQVATWIVHATNMTQVRSMGSPATTVALGPMFNGAPAGTYTLYTTAVSATGLEGDPGDTLLVSWPGGNGKPKGGHGLTVFK